VPLVGQIIWDSLLPTSPKLAPVYLPRECARFVQDLSCKLDPTSAVESRPRGFVFFKKRHVGLLEDRDLFPSHIEAVYFPGLCEGSNPRNNLPKAATPGRSHRKAMCCRAVLESGCVEWLGRRTPWHMPHRIFVLQACGCTSYQVCNKKGIKYMLPQSR
jgi:hypothetical protein